MMQDPYETGVLSQEVHGRLVADLRNVARDAAIMPQWIWTPLAGHVKPDLIEWVRRFHFHAGEGHSGLCLLGKATANAQEVMAAMAGALVRNFIRARVFTTSQLVEAAAAGVAPQASCLLVPNFYLGKALGAQLADWHVAKLLDVLLDRHLQGVQTVVFVTDLKAMSAEYGAAFVHHVQANFLLTDIDG